MGDMVSRQESNVVPLSKLRAELVEAKAEKSLPRLQGVIGAATVAAEMQRRVARLADGKGSPVEVVDAAREGMRQAATVQLEAIAAASRIAQEMQEAGQRVGPKGKNRHVATPENVATAAELLGEKPREGETAEQAGNRATSTLARWKRVGDIPDEVREKYIEEASVEDQDVTVAGLLRYANPKEPKERTSVEASYDDVVRLAGQILRYDAVTIASYASNTKRRTQFRKLIEQLREWADKTDPILT